VHAVAVYALVEGYRAYSRCFSINFFANRKTAFSASRLAIVALYRFSALRCSRNRVAREFAFAFQLFLDFRMRASLSTVCSAARYSQFHFH
jgi:hypothetical protein